MLRTKFKNLRRPARAEKSGISIEPALKRCKAATPEAVTESDAVTMPSTFNAFHLLQGVTAEYVVGADRANATSPQQCVVPAVIGHISASGNVSDNITHSEISRGIHRHHLNTTTLHLYTSLLSLCSNFDCKRKFYLSAAVFGAIQFYFISCTTTTLFTF